jgi:hypothetical protein
VLVIVIVLVLPFSVRLYADTPYADRSRNVSAGRRIGGSAYRRVGVSAGQRFQL